MGCALTDMVYDQPKGYMRAVAAWDNQGETISRCPQLIENR